VTPKLDWRRSARGRRYFLIAWFEVLRRHYRGKVRSR
jgi:hypothetical protein